MKKIVLTFCIITACILILTSFNPVIGYFSVKNSKNKDSPLFTLRIKRVQNLQSSSITSEYLGKNIPIEIIFPTRYIIKKDMLIELSKIDIQNKIDIGDTEILNKWQFVLQITGNNLAIINKILREESEIFKHLVDSYNDLSVPELQNIFLTYLHDINLQEYSFLSIYSPTTGNSDTTNITSGFFCNITSGPICQITSQPICELTSQPICDLITILPPCLTLMGLRCPSSGLKCDPPTSGKICDLLTQFGPLLKTIAIILIIAFILFVPVIFVASIFNANVCTKIQDQLTYLFNCTSPE